MSTTPNTETHSALATWFANLWHAITGRGIALWNALQPIIVSEAGKVLEELLPMAEQAVLAAITSTGDKKSAAFDSLKASATQAGIEATTSILNTSIELALQNLKATGQAQ